MTMTAQQAAAIREAARKTYEELFAPAAADYLRTLRDQGIIAPAWRAMREDRDRHERAAVPPGEAA